MIPQYKKVRGRLKKIFRPRSCMLFHLYEDKPDQIYLSMVAQQWNFTRGEWNDLYKKGLEAFEHLDKSFKKPEDDYYKKN